MKKDKEWLKEKVQTMIDEEYRCYDPLIQHGKHVCRVIMDLIDQLDEPERPIIPKFVADYIELNKGWSEDRQDYIEGDNDGLWFALDGNSYGMPNSVSDWLFNEEKVETFARAWLDGYKVEKEKKYYVMNHKGATMLAKTPSGGIACSNCSDLTSVRDEYLERYQLTEKEIKSVDERYWAFAKPVEEVMV